MFKSFGWCPSLSHLNSNGDLPPMIEQVTVTLSPGLRSCLKENFSIWGGPELIMIKTCSDMIKDDSLPKAHDKSPQKKTMRSGRIMVTQMLLSTKMDSLKHKWFWRFGIQRPSWPQSIKIQGPRDTNVLSTNPTLNMKLELNRDSVPDSVRSLTSVDSFFLFPDLFQDELLLSFWCLQVNPVRTC